MIVNVSGEVDSKTQKYRTPRNDHLHRTRIVLEESVARIGTVLDQRLQPSGFMTACRVECSADSQIQTQCQWMQSCPGAYGVHSRNGCQLRINGNVYVANTAASVVH